MILNPFLLERAYNETRQLVRRETREKIRNRRYNALRKAYQRLIENPFINYENGKMLILSDTVTEQGEAKFYRTSSKECRLEEPDNVLCFAFWEGNPCWHRATLEIVENYLLIESELNQASDGKTVHAGDTEVFTA